MSLTINVERSEHGDLLCPLCERPKSAWREPIILAVEWAGSNYLSADKDTPATIEGSATTTWRVACTEGHVLIEASEWYDDNEYPPAPTPDDIVEWLARRRLPIIRDHPFEPYAALDPTTCHNCEKPASRHAQAAALSRPAPEQKS